MAPLRTRTTRIAFLSPGARCWGFLLSRRPLPQPTRFKDIANAILAEQAGADQCSEARKQLIRRFAAAAMLAEQLESRLANGEQIDIAEHATLSSTLVRLAQRIGIDRRATDITPDPLTYARQREQAVS